MSRTPEDLSLLEGGKGLARGSHPNTGHQKGHWYRQRQLGQGKDVYRGLATRDGGLEFPKEGQND